MMHHLDRRSFLFALYGLFCLLPVAQAQWLDQIGVPALRAVATNIDGTGIRVVQPEASSPSLDFEVNPAAAGYFTNRFFYASSLGTATNYPNSVGIESGHADTVGSYLYGANSGVATNVALVENLDADYFINTYLVSNLLVLDAVVVNQSFTFSEQSVPDQQAIDSAYDDYSEYYGTIFVSAPNNYGTYNPPSSFNTTNVVPPGTGYNCICVGAVENGGAHNSLGPTIDNGRCKPDLTAPAGATSFSTPQVSGAVALLLQAALRGDGGGDTNSAAQMQTIKALLLNGAVKPPGWTNIAPSPLDFRHGAGVLNVMNSYAQLAGGKHSRSASNSIPLGATNWPVALTNFISSNHGWDFGVLSSGATNDAVNHYVFNASNGLATVTLVWNRQLGQTNINDLDLFLFNAATSNLVACSTSRVDNVEHLYLPQLASGAYDVQVVKHGGTNVVSDGEVYALAFEFVSPALALAKDGTNAVVTWPVYPAGFVAEARTNLWLGAWATNGMPSPLITNGLNRISLNTTNGNQFFRLRRP